VYIYIERDRSSRGFFANITADNLRYEFSRAQTDTQTHRHTDKQTHRHTDTQKHRHTQTHTDTQTHRHTVTQLRDVG
jgi:hypothetical protein